MCHPANDPAETPRPAMIINLAKRNANPDEERELAEEPGEDGFNRWAAAGYGEPDDAEEPGLDGDFRPDGDEDEDFPYGDDVEFTHPDFSE